MNDDGQWEDPHLNSERPETTSDLVEVDAPEIDEEIPSTEDNLRKLSHRVINMTATMSLMVNNVTAMAESTTKLSEATHELAQKIDKVEDKRRRDRVVFLFSLALLFTVIVIGGFVISSVRNVAKGNSAQLRILREATGPEAQAKQAESTERIVQRIDCNNQESLRRVLQGIPNVSVPPRTPVCESIIGGTGP